MAQVVYAEEALADFGRIIEYLLEHAPRSASAAVEGIQSAVAILVQHPEIGRRVDSERRELVISRGTYGYLALYRFDAVAERVVVLRIRHQREAGYPG